MTADCSDDNLIQPEGFADYSFFKWLLCIEERLSVLPVYYSSVGFVLEFFF